MCNDTTYAFVLKTSFALIPKRYRSACARTYRHSTLKIGHCKSGLAAAAVLCIQ